MVENLHCSVCKSTGNVTCGVSQLSLERHNCFKFITSVCNLFLIVLLTTPVLFPHRLSTTFNVSYINIMYPSVIASFRSIIICKVSSIGLNCFFFQVHVHVCLYKRVKWKCPLLFTKLNAAITHLLLTVKAMSANRLNCWVVRFVHLALIRSEVKWLKTRIISSLVGCRPDVFPTLQLLSKSLTWKQNELS